MQKSGCSTPGWLWCSSVPSLNKKFGEFTFHSLNSQYGTASSLYKLIHQHWRSQLLIRSIVVQDRAIPHPWPFWHSANYCAFQKTCQTQIDTKLVHENCAGHISRTTCLIALVSFVSHSPTCTAGPGALSFYNFFLKPLFTSPASICLNLPQVEATWG